MSVKNIMGKKYCNWGIKCLVALGIDATNENTSLSWRNKIAVASGKAMVLG